MFSRNTIIFLPLIAFLSYKIRFDFLWVPTNVLDILLVFAIVFSVFQNKVRIRSYIHKERLFLSFAALFVFSAVLPMFFEGASIEVIAGQWKSIVLLPVLYGISLHVLLFYNVIHPAHIVASAFTGVAIVSVFALQAFFSGNITYDGRLAFPYRSPNELAMVFSPFIGGVVAWMLRSKKHFSIFLWAVLIVAFFLVIITRSSGAFLSLSALVLAIYWLSLATRRRRWLVVGVTSIVLLTVFLAGFSGFFAEMVDGRTSLGARVEIWRSSFVLLRSNWQYGIGFGVFQEYYLSLQPYFSPYQEWAVPHPHNIILASLLGAGVIGFTALIGVLFVSFYSLRSSVLSFAVASAVVVMIFHGFVDTTIFRNDLALLFWGGLSVIRS